MLHQFRFEYATGLNEQIAVNRFVRDLHRVIIGILQFQPAGDLLRCFSCSFLATNRRSLPLTAKRHGFGRFASS